MSTAGTQAKTDPFVRLSQFVFRRRWWVLGAWIVIIVGLGATLAPRAEHVLKGGGYTVPGSESVRADDLLDSRFLESDTRDAVLVFRSIRLTVDEDAYKGEVSGVIAKVRRLGAVRGVLDFYDTGNPALVSQDRHTTLVQVALKGDDSAIQAAIPELRSQFRGVTLEHWVTGRPAVDYDVTVQSQKDLQKSEALTIPLILVLLLIVFRTVISALIPLVLGITSISIANSLLFLIGSVFDTSVFALNVGSLLGLGLSIDYALFIVSRYRDQRREAQEPAAALARTMATAGRSITYSGATVMLAMLALAALTFDISIVRSIALAVLLVTAAAVVAGLTLLPALLALLGDRIEWLRVLPRSRPRPGAQGFWYRLSRTIMRRPWVWLAGGLVVLLVMAIPVRDLALGRGGTTTRDESRNGYDVVNSSFGGNFANPVLVVLDARRPGGVWTPEFLAAIEQVTARAKADPRVQDVFSLSTVLASLPREKYLALQATDYQGTPLAKLPLVDADAGNDVALVTVIPRYGATDSRTSDLVRELRGSIVPGSALPPPAAAHVGGETALTTDYAATISGRFPYVVATVMVIIFVILMMFFQSLVLPAKAMLLNLASVMATFGALVFIFQYGNGTRLLGFDSFKSISAITPTILYVTIFALSTDYEVFMLSRVKEYYVRTRDNDEAVAAGLQHTAGVITAAALILVGTFASFAIGDAIAIKEIGIGLAIGVLLDATLVRVVLVPATMRLMGDANWWMPAWLRRIVPRLSEGGDDAAEPEPDPVPVRAG